MKKFLSSMKIKTLILAIALASSATATASVPKEVNAGTTSKEYTTTITTANSLDEALTFAQKLSPGSTITLKFKSGGTNRYWVTNSNLEKLKNLSVRGVKFIFEPTDPKQLTTLDFDKDVELPTNGANDFLFRNMRFRFTNNNLSMKRNGNKYDLDNAGFLNGNLVW